MKLTVLDQPRTHEHRLVGQVEDQSYVSNEVQSHMKYFVGIKKKGAKTVTLVPAHQLFSLVPHRKESDIVEERAVDSINQQHIRLAETFGSRKRVTHLRKAMTNRKASDEMFAASSTVIDDKIAESADISDLLVKAVRPSELLPTCDMEATTPETAYPLEGLMPMDHSAEFETDLLVEVAGSSEKGTEKWPEFVVARFKELDRIPSDAMKATQAMLLLMYTVYVRLSVMQGRDLNDREKTDAEMAVCPMPVWYWLKDTFMTARKGKRIMFNDEQRKRIRLHAIAIALHIANFDIDDATPIVADLKIPARDLAELARQMGCTVTAGRGKRKAGGTATGGRSSIKLDVLPLKFPEKRRGRARQ